MNTVKRAPIYEDRNGNLYEKVKQTDALRDPAAIREIVGVGTDAEVRWLLPIGTTHGSEAESNRVDMVNSYKTAGK